MAKSSIPGYTILKSIGKGGASKVFLAIQLSVGRTVAIKILSKNFSEGSNFSLQFFKEASCGVLSHPNIITIFDAGECNGRLYIAMEYLIDGDLKQKIQQGITEKQAIKIITQITQALSYAHNNNFTHRDIKPENILFDEHGNAILADFGIAKSTRFSHNETFVGNFVGTPDYISPEQVSDQPVDHRTDLYNLGVVYYEILTGVKPFIADSTYALIFKHLKDPVPTLPKEYQHHQKIINKLLEKKPKNRYQSANNLLTDLHQLEKPEPIKKEPSYAIRNSAVLITLLIALSAVIYTQLQSVEKKLKPTHATLINTSINKDTIEKLEQDIKKSTEANLRLQNEKSNLSIISNHLTNALKYLGLNQLTYPEKQNALYEFKQALKLAPHNPQAKYGIQSIINHLKLMANNEKEKENYNDSIELIKSGLEIDAENTELLSLHNELTNLIENKNNIEKIKTGLKRADRFIKKNKLIDAKLELNELARLYKNNKQIKLKLAKLNKTIKRQKFIKRSLKSSLNLIDKGNLHEPYISQACENSYSLLQLDPNNKEVKSFIKSCSQQYLRLAKKAGSTENSIELIEIGLNYTPNDPELSQYLQTLLISEPNTEKNR